MIFEERIYPLGDKKLMLRSATEADAEMLQSYIKTVTGETRFLMCESDEMNITAEDELEFIKSQGYEQAELTVVGGNERAIHLYESFGFTEYGRLKNANKYDDGTYADDILMVKTFGQDD